MLDYVKDAAALLALGFLVSSFAVWTNLLAGA